MAWNAAEQSGYQSNYGSGLGTIYQFGHQTPMGPYSSLQGEGATSSSTIKPTGGANPADQWLTDVMNGKNLPFGPAQQAAQLTQQTDMNAAAEHARNGQMEANAAAGGASATDPSFAGAKAANFARRQTDNSRAAGNIASQAGSANFGAQANAAGQLSQNAMQREGWQQQNANQAMGFMPWNQGGRTSGGNNFGGSNQGFLGYRPAASPGATYKG